MVKFKAISKRDPTVEYIPYALNFERGFLLYRKEGLADGVRVDFSDVILYFSNGGDYAEAL